MGSRVLRQASWRGPAHRGDDMTQNEPINAAVTEDLVFDVDTGEILEWPEELRDLPGKVEYLTLRLTQAQAAEKAWKQYGGFLKQAIGKLLTDADLKSLRTAYGTPGWRTRRNREGVVERLPEIVTKYEL